MPPKQYTFTVVSNKEIAENILLLSIKSNEILHYHAGQYFSFKIADKVNRSYSIASGPKDENLEFLVEVIEGGVGSTFIKNLHEGDSYQALGPLGFFTLEKTGALNEETPLIFVATGSGIAPVRSMVRYILAEQPNRKVSLYFGLRYDDKAYFFDEFQELDSKNPNFDFHPVISRPSEKWIGAKGYCQDCVKQIPADPTARVFICGSNKNVDSISSELITHGYLKERVHFEKFG